MVDYLFYGISLLMKLSIIIAGSCQSCRKKLKNNFKISHPIFKHTTNSPSHHKNKYKHQLDSAYLQNLHQKVKEQKVKETMFQLHILNLNKYKLQLVIKAKEMITQHYFFSQVDFMRVYYGLNCYKIAQGTLQFISSSIPQNNFMSLSKTKSLQKQEMISFHGSSFGHNHSVGIGLYKVINNPLFRSHTASSPEKYYLNYVYNPQLDLYSPDSNGFVTTTPPEFIEDRLVISSDSINDVNPMPNEGFVFNIFQDYTTNKITGIPSTLYYTPLQTLKKQTPKK